MQLIAVQEAREAIKVHYDQTLVQTTWSAFEYKGKGVYSAGNDEYHISVPALRQILLELGMNNASYMSSSEKLKAMIISELLSSEARIGMLVNADDTVIQFIRMEKPYIKPLDVFDRVIDVFDRKKMDTKVQVDINNGNGLIVNFITNDQYAVEEVGDTACAGICVKTRIHRTLPEISMGPFAYVLQCSNGLIGHLDDIRIMEADDISGMLENIESSADILLETARKDLIPIFIRLSSIRIKDPVGFIRRVSEDLYLRRNVMYKLMKMLPVLGEEPTVYRIVNFITAQANQYDSPMRMKLQELGGYITESVVYRCPTCHNVV